MFINEEIVEKARRCIGENEKRRNETVQIIRRWIEQQPHFSSVPTGEIIIIIFLIRLWFILIYRTDLIQMMPSFCFSLEAASTVCKRSNAKLIRTCPWEQLYRNSSADGILSSRNCKPRSVQGKHTQHERIHPINWWVLLQGLSFHCWNTTKCVARWSFCGHLHSTRYFTGPST